MSYSIADKKYNLLGQKFGRLTVIGRAPNKNKTNRAARWYCQCDCGNPKVIIAAGTELRRGKVKSCGCYSKDANKARRGSRRKENVIDMTSEEYAIGYTSKNEPFWFDKEDIDLVKQYCWHYNNHGYLQNRGINYETGKKQNIYLHRLVMKIEDESVMVDHINHPYGENLKIDNRKQNLRIVNRKQNCMNRHITPKNQTGVKGVCFDKKRGKWLSHLIVNKKTVLFKHFETFEEAVRARKKAEEEFCGKYAFKTDELQQK